MLQPMAMAVSLGGGGGVRPACSRRDPARGEGWGKRAAALRADHTLGGGGVDLGGRHAAAAPAGPFKAGGLSGFRRGRAGPASVTATNGVGSSAEIARKSQRGVFDLDRIDCSTSPLPRFVQFLWWEFGRWLHGDWLRQENRGLSHLPLDAGCFLIASNHQSHLDCSCLYTAAWAGGAKRVYALGAKDYFFRNRLMALFVTRLMRVIPISRRKFTDREIETLRQIVATAGPDMPTAVIIFPEGTRSTTGETGRFKIGAGHIASLLGVPVVPAHVAGTSASLPKGRYVPRREEVRVEFGAPLNVRAFLGAGVEEETVDEAEMMLPVGSSASYQSLGGGAPDTAGGVAGGVTWDRGDEGTVRKEGLRKEGLQAFADALREAVVAMASTPPTSPTFRPTTSPLSSCFVVALTALAYILRLLEDALWACVGIVRGGGPKKSSH